MNYVRETEALGCCGPDMTLTRAAEPMESVTDLMHRTANAGQAILSMAEKIEGHLFGRPIPDCAEKKCAPDCFRDELAEHKATLDMAEVVLNRLCGMIGI